jgi:polysaccharide chain length determinant protein (PEP-CTERM system associated)
MATPHSDETTRGLGLSGLLEIMRRRRLLAVLPFLFVLTAAASLAFFLPSLWTAKATILVNRQEIPVDYVKPSVQADLEGRLLTLSQDILSPPRLQQIITENNLYPAMRRAKPIDDVVEKMRKDIRIDVQNNANDRRGARENPTVAFNVAYTAPDPVVAANVTNTLAALFIQENVRVRGEQAAGTSQFLESQLTDLRGKLQAQERRITEYKERNMGELPEQRDVNLRTLERLQTQLQLAHENNRRANERRTLITQSLGELDLTSGMAAGGATTAMGPNVTPTDTAAARLNLLRQELATMETRYSPKYPDVVQLREQIRVLETKVETDKQNATAALSALPRQDTADKAARQSRELRVVPQNAYIQSLMQQLDQAAVDAKTTGQEIATLNQEMRVYQRRLENTPKREQELALITRDYETTRDMFRALLAKSGEAGIAAELEQKQKGETFRVIEPAGLPERPTGPNRFRLLLVGLVLALGASGLAVVLAEQVDTSYRRVDEVRATAPMPVLSTIPRITTEQDRSRALRQRRFATAAVAVGLMVVAGSSFAIAHNNQSLVSLLMAEPAPKR